MNKLILAAVMAAGVLAATPADAQWWRSCGGHAYEGCDGVQRGPYAVQRHVRNYRYHVPPRVHACAWHRRNFFGPGGHYIGSRTVWVCN